MSHRLSATVDEYPHPFALLYPGLSALRRFALLRGQIQPQDFGDALSYAKQNPDYMRELDRGDSMRKRGGTYTDDGQ